MAFKQSGYVNKSAVYAQLLTLLGVPELQSQATNPGGGYTVDSYSLEKP